VKVLPAGPQAVPQQEQDMEKVAEKKPISPLMLVALLVTFVALTVIFAMLAARGPGVLYIPTTMFGTVSIGIIVRLSKIYFTHTRDLNTPEEPRHSLQELGTVGAVGKFPGLGNPEACADSDPGSPSEREECSEMKGQLGWSLLHKASTTGDQDIAGLTLDEGISLESRDILGFTPLHQACRLLNTKMVAYLISRGASIEARNDVGWTSLHVSVNLDAWDIVKLLLDSGADPRATTPKGETALNLAEKQGYKELAEMLRGYLKESRK
jgi:hypothetical protein